MRNLDEIIHTINSIYSHGETTMLMLKDEKDGLIRVNTALWTSVYNFRGLSFDNNHAFPPINKADFSVALCIESG